MTKRFVLSNVLAVLFFFIVMLLFSSCKSNPKIIDSMSSSGEELQTVQQTEITSASTPSPSFTSTVVHTDPSSSAVQDAPSSSNSEEDFSTPHIVWAISLVPYITEEAREEVNRFLRDSGIDCQVDFVAEAVATDFKDWFDKQKSNNSTPDIIPSHGWTYGDYDAAKFVREEFLPLDDYLKTGDGEKLKENYSNLEWKQAVLDGKIYTVPGRPIDQRFGLFLYINDRIRPSFDEAFDGTYASLSEIAEQLKESGYVSAYNIFGTSEALAFLGYKMIHFAPYDLNTAKFVDITKQSELRELLQEMYEDIESGIFNAWVSPDQISEDIAIYVGTSSLSKIPDGFSEYVLLPAVEASSFGMSYGVSILSSKQELAFKVLSACFSDPRIASIICWREDMSEEWRKWTDYFDALGSCGITGFLPDLSEEEIQLLLTFTNKWRRLATLNSNNSGGATLPPDFLKAVDSFFENAQDYGEIYDKINRQLEEWTEKQKD